MAAQTVTAAVAYVREDFPDQSTTQALAVMQEVVDDFAPLYPLWTSTTTFSSLVAGTATYNFSATPASIRTATYYLDSGDTGTRLTARSIDELDLLQPLWRGFQNSTPNGFYITSDGTNQILGLTPPPDTTSASSYPQVVVASWDYKLLAFATTTGYVTSLPVSLQSTKAITAETKARLAIRVKDPNASAYIVQAQRALRSLHVQTFGVSVNARQLLLSSSQLRTSRRV